MPDTQSIPQSHELTNVIDLIHQKHADAEALAKANTPYNREMARYRYGDVNDRWFARAARHARTATIEFQGDVVKCITTRTAPIVGAGGARKPITEYSSKSRKRLLETVSRMDWTKEHATFITLTYHQKQDNAQAAKRDLRAFLKRMYRKYDLRVVLWRLEPQKRGSWHFHLIVWGLPYYPKKTLIDDWRAVTGQDTITQCDIKLIDNAKKARSYVAKYIAKPLPEIALKVVGLLLLLMPLHQFFSYLDYLTNLAVSKKPGRFWGIENRKLINWCQLVVTTIRIGKTFHDFKRYARKKWSGINRSEGVGYTVFVDDVKQWYRLLATEATNNQYSWFTLYDDNLRLEMGI